MSDRKLYAWFRQGERVTVTYPYIGDAHEAWTYGAVLMVSSDGGETWEEVR